MSATHSASPKKKKLGSYPATGVLLGITLALLVVGVYGLLFNVSYQVKQRVVSNIELQVFLERFITPTERFRLEQTLATRDYVLNTEEKQGVEFISKEEEAQRLIAQTGEDFMEFLGENPLRDVLVVRIKPDFVDTASISFIKSQLEAERGVFEVAYMEDMVTKINANLMRVGVVAGVLSVILFVAVIILINNTIKLALFSQRFLIRSMQLVGARPGFVQSPFLRRSLIHGAIGGILASGLLYGLFTYFTTLFPELEDVKDINQFLILFAALIVLGGLLATYSTWRAVRKYLRMSLDDLY